MSDNKIFNIAVLSITTIGVGMLYNYTVENSQENIVEATKATQVEVVSPTVSNVVESKSYYGIVRGIKEEKLYPSNQSKAVDVFVKTGDLVKKGDILAIYDSSKVDEQIRIYENNYNRVLEDKERIENEVNKIKDKIKDIAVEINKNEKIIDYYSNEYNNPTPVERLSQAKENIEVLSSNRVKLEEELKSLNLNEYEERLDNAEKSREVIRQSKDGYTIKAPFDGIVTLMDVKKGETSNPFLAPIEVSDNSKITFSIKLPKEEVSRMKIGDKYNLAVNNTLGDIVNREGIVEYISDTEDSITRMYNVKLSLPDNDAKIGSSGLLEIPIQEKIDAILIPRSALHKDGKKNFIYIINAKNEIEKKYVTVGIKNKGNIEIISGVDKNDKIVVNKDSDIKEGMIVTIK